MALSCFFGPEYVLNLSGLRQPHFQVFVSFFSMWKIWEFSAFSKGLEQFWYIIPVLVCCSAQKYNINSRKKFEMSENGWNLFVYLWDSKIKNHSVAKPRKNCPFFLPKLHAGCITTKKSGLRKALEVLRPWQQLLLVVVTYSRS